MEEGVGHLVRIQRDLMMAGVSSLGKVLLFAWWGSTEDAFVVAKARRLPLFRVEELDSASSVSFSVRIFLLLLFKEFFMKLVGINSTKRILRPTNHGNFILFI